MMMRTMLRAIVAIYSNGEFGDYDDNLYGMGFGGQFIEAVYT